MAGRTPEQHQPAANHRRRSYEDCVTTMKPRSTKFDARENTASSRQHAPRFAVRSFPAQSARSSPASQEDVSLLLASSPHESSARSPNNAADTAATEGGRDESHLLTVHEVAKLLQVPVSWVYGRTRKRSLERIPCYRLGKYWRFRQDEVLAWVESQRRDSHVA
jgi:excisionase family DNA binding protein